MFNHKFRNGFLIPAFFCFIAIVLWSSSCGTGQSGKNGSRMARLILNYDEHFDVDVILPGESSPACRLLLPESIYGEGLEAILGVHTYPAVWKESGDELQGSVSLDQGVECGLWMKPSAEGVLMKISIKNTSQSTYRDVRVDICASMSHLPNTDNADWSNRDFLPDSVPLDRTLQGKYWYSVVTPEKLKAWTPGGDWIVMHPRPENPEPDPEDLYWHVMSKTDNNPGCAVLSMDGKKLFYQVWRTGHSRYQSPFAGNACMHLLPQVAEELPPGETATIEGRAGFFDGTREELADEFNKFINP